MTQNQSARDADYWRKAYEDLVDQTGRDLNDGLGVDPRCIGWPASSGRSALRLSSGGQGSSAARIPTEGVPDDVAELVVAARVVAFEDQGRDAIRRLDKASEAFADRVRWDNQPDEDSDDAVDRFIATLPLSPAEQAYVALWSASGEQDPRMHQCRKMLRDIIGPDGQARAVRHGAKDHPQQQGEKP